MPERIDTAAAGYFATFWRYIPLGRNDKGVFRGGFCLQLHVVLRCRINGTGTSYAPAFLNNYIRCDLAE